MAIMFLFSYVEALEMIMPLDDGSTFDTPTGTCPTGLFGLSLVSDSILFNHSPSVYVKIAIENDYL